MPRLSERERLTLEAVAQRRQREVDELRQQQAALESRIADAQMLADLLLAEIKGETPAIATQARHDDALPVAKRPPTGLTPAEAVELYEREAKGADFTAADVKAYALQLGYKVRPTFYSNLRTHLDRQVQRGLYRRDKGRYQRRK